MNYREYKEQQLIGEIEAWLAWESVRLFGRVLIELCERKQCMGHPEKWNH